MNLTDNQTASMLAGMMASGVMAQGLMESLIFRGIWLEVILTLIMKYLEMELNGMSILRKYMVKKIRKESRLQPEKECLENYKQRGLLLFLQQSSLFVNYFSFLKRAQNFFFFGAGSFEPRSPFTPVM